MEPSPEALLRRRVYLLDLTALGDLPNMERSSRVRLVVSASLDLVLSAPPSPERDALLHRLANQRTSGGSRDTVLIDYPAVQEWVSSYQVMKRAKRIRVIPDAEGSPDLREALTGLTRELKTDPRVRVDGGEYTRASIIRTHLSTILQHSMKTGTAILMRGQVTIKRLSGRIDELHLPERADSVVDAKKRFVDRVFGFPGGRAAKAFIGVALAVAGGNPLAAGAGIALAFLDP